MARGNEIVVSANPRGVFIEGTIGASAGGALPGTIMQVDATVATVGNRHTYKKYTAGADGNRPIGALYILRSNDLLGKITTYPYQVGDRCFLYCPLAGEEVNALVDVAGNISHAAGDQMEVQNATGKLIATAGTPQSTPFTLLEAITTPAADTLAWCLYNGY